MPSPRHPRIISKAGAALRQLPRLGSTPAEADAGLLQLPFAGRCVMLKGPITQCESYAQPGMRARVCKLRTCGSEGAVAVTLDFSEFEAHNRSLETVAWDDDQLIVRLTAREAEEYQPVEDYFLPGVDVLMEYMAPLNEEAALGLYRSFLEEGRPREDYIAWLEEQLALARPDLLEELRGSSEPDP